MCAAEPGRAWSPRRIGAAEAPGGVVSIERRKGTAWVTVGEATVTSEEPFGSSSTLVPAGGYRARMAATEGFAAAISLVDEVTG